MDNQIPDMCQDVSDFIKKFGLLQETMSVEKGFVRINHLTEELNEFKLAFLEGNRAEMLDALIDLVYVAIGTAILYDLPFNAGWKLVHNANMKKIKAEKAVQSKRGTSFDVVKPKGWSAPDISGLVKTYDQAGREIKQTIFSKIDRHVTASDKHLPPPPAGRPRTS